LGLRRRHVAEIISAVGTAVVRLQWAMMHGYDTLPLEKDALLQYRKVVPPVLTTLGSSPILTNAQRELIRRIRGMLGRTLRPESRAFLESSIVISTSAEIRSVAPQLDLSGRFIDESFLLKTLSINGSR
jgi:alpha-glucuronidase